MSAPSFVEFPELSENSVPFDHSCHLGFKTTKFASKESSFFEHGSMASAEPLVDGNSNEAINYMAPDQDLEDGNFNEANNQGISQRICSPFSTIWEGSKYLFRSAVFLKGSAVAVGLWKPKKSFGSVAMAFVFFSELFLVLKIFYHTFVCRSSDATRDSWFCGNSSSNSTSLRSSSPMGALQGIDKRHVLGLVVNFSVFMSNVAFFWCMWKLEERSNYCIKMAKAYEAAKNSNWVILNCTMFTFGILLLIQLVWVNLSFEFSLAYRVGVSLTIIPVWVTLTISWLFALITNAMKHRVLCCQKNIREGTDCSITDDIISIHKCSTTDDIIRRHKRLCKELSSTSEAFKIWFAVHWFLLAILVVIFVTEMVSLFKYASDWFLSYEFVLWTIISLYVFVYPNYCASCVTARCNKMLKDLNMITDDEWQIRHPLCNRSQLTFFLQYAQFTNCGYHVGDITFGSSLAWFSTLIAISGLAVKLF